MIEIKAIEKIGLLPTDIILVTVDSSHAQMKIVEEFFREQFPKNKVIVKPASIKLEIISPSPTDEQ